MIKKRNNDLTGVKHDGISESLSCMVTSDSPDKTIYVNATADVTGIWDAGPNGGKKLRPRMEGSTDISIISTRTYGDFDILGSPPHARIICEPQTFRPITREKFGVKSNTVLNINLDSIYDKIKNLLTGKSMEDDSFKEVWNTFFRKTKFSITIQKITYTINVLTKESFDANVKLYVAQLDEETKKKFLNFVKEQPPKNESIQLDDEV